MPFRVKTDDDFKAAKPKKRTIVEAAEILGVSIPTVERALKDGRLPDVSDASLESFEPRMDHRDEAGQRLLCHYVRRAQLQVPKLEACGVKADEINDLLETVLAKAEDAA